MEVGQGPNWGCSAKGKKKHAYNCKTTMFRKKELCFYYDEVVVF
jgi:hypothetical protein